MSDQTQSSNQQTIVIALVVVAVLLAALVGVLVYQQSQAAKLAALDTTAPAGADAGASPMGAAPSGAPAATGEPVAFDAKTATKVPGGTTPEAFVKAYNEAVIAGKFEEAYKMLPVDKQKSYGDVASYTSQVKQYGITGYKMGKPVESGDTVSVAAVQENPAMPITYTWNFKKVGDTWFVESRVMGGTVE
ncbi:MAG: hypothetical protein HGB10_10910 [Coriobacteriia bacterium]|nr:hypothetical protein [Coriobacteriia bacterium]